MSPAVMWFSVAIAFFALELFTSGFVCLFFGVGALAAAGISVWYTSMPVALATFCVVSLISMVFFRSRIMRALQGRSKTPDNFIAQGSPATQVGRRGIVTQPLGPGRIGEIELGGSFWRAHADDYFEVGTPVEVCATDAHDELLLKVCSLPSIK